MSILHLRFQWKSSEMFSVSFMKNQPILFNVVISFLKFLENESLLSFVNDEFFSDFTISFRAR